MAEYLFEDDPREANAPAGGPGYLLHFADARSICENTMRRGFTPDGGI